jgi:hypothetical protein
MRLPFVLLSPLVIGGTGSVSQPGIFSVTAFMSLSSQCFDEKGISLSKVPSVHLGPKLSAVVLNHDCNHFMLQEQCTGLPTCIHIKYH